MLYTTLLSYFADTALPISFEFFIFIFGKQWRIANIKLAKWHKANLEKHISFMSKDIYYLFYPYFTPKLK